MQLAEARLREPVKSELQVLSNGEESYLEKSDAERTILKALDAIPVERNGGIDGFLRSYVDGHPVAVRIQKADEDLETAKRKLMAAGKTRQCARMILVRTRHNGDYTLFDWTDENLLVIDAYDVAIGAWLGGRGQINHPADEIAPAQVTSAIPLESRKPLRGLLADLGPGPSAADIDGGQLEMWAAFWQESLDGSSKIAKFGCRRQ